MLTHKSSNVCMIFRQRSKSSNPYSRLVVRKLKVVLTRHAFPLLFLSSLNVLLIIYSLSFHFICISCLLKTRTLFVIMLKVFVYVS